MQIQFPDHTRSASIAALSCAWKGSPLVILQNDGSVYWPIAETMPAEGQNKRLMPFAGKRITVTGKT